MPHCICLVCLLRFCFISHIWGRSYDSCPFPAAWFLLAYFQDCILNYELQKGFWIAIKIAFLVCDALGKVLHERNGHSILAFAFLRITKGWSRRNKCKEPCGSVRTFGIAVLGKSGLSIHHSYQLLLTCRHKQMSS